MTWCLVFTEARRESLVQLLLTKTHHEIYFPRIRERGKKVTMFPNYLFVQMINDQFYNIRWTPHVLNVLHDRQKSLESIVSDLRRRERDGYVRLPRPPRLQKGQQVNIIAGSFEGHVGWYDGQSSHDRVRVLLDLLGRKVPVQLLEKHLAPTPNILRTVKS
jgi:transcription antitermination factor NusG